MPDATCSVHPPPFDYHHPAYRAAAAKAKARSRGRCQVCGHEAPLHAHHWGRPPYPPPYLTTDADLTGLCRDCHIKVHLGTFFESAGGSPHEWEPFDSPDHPAYRAIRDWILAGEFR